MKKFLAIAVSVIFLLGFAASAFAIHAEIPSETQPVVAKGTTQVTLHGSVRVRGEIRDNTTDFNSDVKDTMSWYDERIRLGADITVSDNVTGKILLESGDNTSDTWIWGSSPGGAVGIYGVGNAKESGVTILEGWLQYTNDLINVKVGHMPLALGNLLFFDHRKFGDDAIVLWKNIDNIHLAFLTAKFSEGLATESLCIDPLTGGLGICDPVGLFNVPAFDVAAGVDTVAADDADAYVALAVYKGDGFNVSGDVTWVNDNSFIPGENTDLYNLGARADAKLSDLVTIRGDVEFQFGSLTEDIDFGGYAFMLGADFDLESLDIGVEAGLGSGDDGSDPTSFDTFVNSLSSGIPYITFVRGTRTADNNGISNLTYVKGTVTASPMDKMTVKGALVYMMLTEDIAGEDDAGIEIDASMSYNLAKNLKYWVEGGYWLVGDAYGPDVDNAYALRHGIEMSF